MEEKMVRSEPVKRIIQSGGVVYFPELSNIQSMNVGEHARIHSHVWIGDKVRIGHTVSIQAFAFIPNGVTIHDGVFIGPHVCFTNDPHPPSIQWKETIVESRVSIGANATILPGVRLGEGCKIGAGAVVTKDVPAGETWVGNPARPIASTLSRKPTATFRK